MVEFCIKSSITIVATLFTAGIALVFPGLVFKREQLQDMGIFMLKGALCSALICFMVCLLIYLVDGIW